MRMKHTILFASVVSIALASPVWAQRWGRDRLPREGVCFYKDTNFRGDYFCAGAGEDLRAVPDGMNDRISSIRVFGDAEVTVFRDVRFDGRSSRFDRDVRDLKDAGWNDLISSLRVQSRRGFARRPGAPPIDRQGGDVERIVRRAYQDVLEREPDAAGLRVYRSHMIDDGWSEAQVREALRQSQEFRQKNTMTPGRAQDIVRRAYLEVLKREPDQGSRPYVDEVLRDHWSQQDVERELRNSAEYRNKRR
jgi:Peptidase inhibitor family I36/Domain of unknown function (DUF4214)